MWREKYNISLGEKILQQKYIIYLYDKFNLRNIMLNYW